MKKFALFIQSSRTMNADLEAHRAIMAIDFFNEKLDVINDQAESLEFDEYSLIIIDQLAFDYLGLEKLIELRERFPDKQLVLAKSKILNKKDRVLISDLSITSITKPILTNIMIKKLKGLGLHG